MRHLVKSETVASAAKTMPVGDHRKNHDKVIDHHHGPKLQEHVFDPELQQRTRRQRQRLAKAISESPTLKTSASSAHATTRSTDLDTKVRPHGEHSTNTENRRALEL